jgi:imidazolonepropionase
MIDNYPSSIINYYMERFDTIWLGARLATMEGPGLSAVEDGALAARGGKIVFTGPTAALPAGWDAVERIACDGRWITPGLIDCHTHLVYGGNRAHEFELRLAGASYEQVARAGGGIVSTVQATRAADDHELRRQALPRLDSLIAEGVTTLEIKSGYGLDVDTELKQLRVGRGLAEVRPVTVTTTCLAAHAVPPEFKFDKAGYLRRVVNEIVPSVKAAGLADAVDAFCEGIAFSAEETAVVFEAARRLGLPVKLHADQLSNLHGAALAAHFSALSADHLEYTDEAGVKALAEAGTVAVLLPGAFYFLRATKLPPIDLLRLHHVPLALATDCNPGSSPLTSILLAMNMGATLFRLTVDECLAAVTREAARALGLSSQVGTLAVGKWCDLAIWSVERLSELVYRIGFNPLYARVKRGVQDG